MLLSLNRVRLLLAGHVSLVAMVSMLAAGQAQAATATVAGSCSPATYPGSGYFTSLKVSGTSCASGRKVQLAHYKCRVKGGTKGKCRGPVLTYRCSETRKSIATEFNARVTCTKSGRKVVWTYQQNL